ncbi:MAG: alpha/beta hydrolase [Bacteroidota bacterium]
MKTIYTPILFLILLTGLTLTGCSGYKYASMPALEFEDIDYGFDTQRTQSDVSLAYIDEGSGSQTVILIHGLASNAGFWRYVIPDLSKSYRVIAVDLPGFGKSDKGDFSYGISFYADQILALMNELKIDKAILAGHSMGGQISMNFALQYPERLNKLVLASPAGIESFKPGEAKWLRNVFRIDDIVYSGEEIVRTNLNRNFYSWSDEYEWMVEERVRMAKGKEMKEFAHAVIQSVGAMLDEPTTNRLHEITTQTLIIYGEHDGLIPNPFLHPGFTSKVFEKGAREIPDARLVELPKCGHLLQIEQPEQFVSELKQFIGS